MRDKSRIGDIMICCVCNGMMGILDDQDGQRWICQCGRSVPVVSDEDVTDYEDWSEADR